MLLSQVTSISPWAQQLGCKLIISSILPVNTSTEQVLQELQKPAVSCLPLEVDRWCGTYDGLGQSNRRTVF